MSEITHTPVCLEHQAWLRQMENAIQAYYTRWPSTCPHCRGVGRFDDSDPSVGLYGWAPCIICTEQGYCPRCGELSLIIYNAEDPEEGYIGPCLLCGYNFGEEGGTVDDLPPDIGGEMNCICPRQWVLGPDL